MSLAPRYEPVPLTPIPEGLIITQCNSVTPIETFNKKRSCATCGMLKTEDQLVKKKTGGVKCLACIRAAKNGRKPAVKLAVPEPKRPRIEGYQFSDLRWPTSRPVR